MRRGRPHRFAVFGIMLLASATQGRATEYGFSSYGLGGSAWGSASTPIWAPTFTP